MRKPKSSAFRHRKHIPYGSKGYCGLGGEFYSNNRGGFYITDVVDKRQERKKNKMNEIMKDEELENKNLNDLTLEDIEDENN